MFLRGDDNVRSTCEHIFTSRRSVHSLFCVKITSTHGRRFVLINCLSNAFVVSACRMSSLTASLCLAFVLLLRLGGVPGPPFSSPVLCQVWKLDAFLLDSFQELFSRALSADPDLAYFVVEVSLRDRQFCQLVGSLFSSTWKF